jgi:predicted nucleic acid-binding protein
MACHSSPMTPPVFRFDPPRAVLDTNVVLDWLVFANPAVAPITQAVESGRLRWVATAEMRAELAEVLRRGLPRNPTLNTDRIWSTWSACAHIEDIPPPAGLAAPLRCTDPDDQKFIDFALHRADWLFTRDRAVLRLARRALPRGLSILTPEAWTAPLK